MEGVADFGPDPFLIKLYDTVDDPNTDTIISWGSAGESFVIWDTGAFITEIIPRYFKNNSSFARQLFSYGFSTVNGLRPFGSELANEGFQRGQRQLLKTIKRRRSPSSPSSSQQGQASSAACPEVGLDGEVHRLQRDKGTPLAEVAKQRQDPIPSCSPNAERSDLDMPRSVANGSNPRLGSGQDAQMRRSMTMPDTHTGLSSATTTGIEAARATITAASGIGIGGARATTTAASDTGIGGARAVTTGTVIGGAHATTAAASDTGIGGARATTTGTAIGGARTTTGTGIGGARATTTAASGTGIGGVRAVRETEAQRRLRFSLATSDLEAGGGARGAAPAQRPSEEETRTLRDVFIQIYATLLTGSFMAYPVLKDAPKHVKIITFGGLVVVIAIVLFAGILSGSLARRRLAFWLVTCSAVALLTCTVAFQLS